MCILHNTYKYCIPDDDKKNKKKISEHVFSPQPKQQTLGFVCCCHIWLGYVDHVCPYIQELGKTAVLVCAVTAFLELLQKANFIL